MLKNLEEKNLEDHFSVTSFSPPNVLQSAFYFSENHDSVD